MVEFQWFLIALSVLDAGDNTDKQVCSQLAPKRCVNGGHTHTHTHSVFSREDLLQRLVQRVCCGLSTCFSSPAREQLCDFSPAVSQFLVRLVDDPVLFLGPRRLLHLRVEVVVPALAALLADTTLQVLGDHRPALRSVLLDQLDHLGRWALVRERGRGGRRHGRKVTGEKRGRKERKQ